MSRQGKTAVNYDPNRLRVVYTLVGLFAFTLLLLIGINWFINRETSDIASNTNTPTSPKPTIETNDPTGSNPKIDSFITPTPLPTLTLQQEGNLLDELEKLDIPEENKNLLDEIREVILQS